MTNIHLTAIPVVVEIDPQTAELHAAMSARVFGDDTEPERLLLTHFDADDRDAIRRTIAILMVCGEATPNDPAGLRQATSVMHVVNYLSNLVKNITDINGEVQS